MLSPRRALAALLTITVFAACPDHQPATPDIPIPEVTNEDALAELHKMPPIFRQQFESEAGLEELKRLIRDRRLAEREARRRGHHNDPDIIRQVKDLEQRLLIQKLLDEEGAQRTVAEDELRAWYEKHQAEFAQPETRRVARILARSRDRADSFQEEIDKGTAFEVVARTADGPERVREGDIGFLTAKDGRDRRMIRAAFDLEEPGAVSNIIETEEGYAILKLLERRAPRVPPFDEVRTEVEGRYQPTHQRKVFNEVIRRLRKEDAL